jgi:Na+/H+ antiporter NhaD/arsenite permease-like protein
VLPLDSLAFPLRFDPSIYISLAFLFGIAAHFRAMDGYSFLRRIISLLADKFGILYAVVIVTAIFSPFILNDVVVLILAPVLVRYAKQFSVDVTPLLVALITFSNIASSLTPIGNPQNILLWQASAVSPHQFVLGTWLPLAVSGILAASLLYPFKNKLGSPREVPQPRAVGSHDVSLRRPAIYLLAVAVMIFSLNLVRIPNVVTLGVAFLSGFVFTSGSLRRLLREFDVKSLLIICLLIASVTFVATAIQPALAPYVAPVAAGVQPYSALYIGFVSNIISNVPATQLILSVTSVTPRVAPKIAVQAGLAGNIDPIASFANILVLLIVRRNGLPIRKVIILQLIIGMISYLPAFI